MTFVNDSFTWSALVSEDTTSSSEDSSFFIQQNREETIRLIYICVSVFGIPGNLLTLLAILTSPPMRKKPFNLLLVNQSAIDLCLCICGVLIQVIQPEFPPNRKGIWICKIWSSAYIYWGLFSNSNYNLATIAIERFLATHNPLKYDEDRVLRRMPYVAAIIWSSGFIVVLPNVITGYPISRSECIICHQVSYAEHWVIHVWYTFFLYLLPLITMVYCYVRIIYYLHRQSKLEPKTSGTGRISLHKAQVHIMQTAVTVSLIFFVIYTYNMIIMYGSIFSNFPRYPYYYVAVCLMILNSSINPYVYCIRYDYFQQRILEICRSTKTYLVNKIMCLTVTE